MRACGGHLDGALGVFLAADVGQVDRLRYFGRRRGGRGLGRLVAADGLAVAQPSDEVAQRLGGEHADALDEGSLRRVDARDDGAAVARVARGADHRQHAVGVAQQPLQREFAQQHRAAQVRFDLAAAGEDADCDGQVVGGALLAEVGGGEVHGDALHGELAAGVADGGADALARFLHGGVGQADDGEGGQAGGDVDLHVDDGAVEADDCAGVDFGEHGSSKRYEGWRKACATRRLPVNGQMAECGR